MPPPRKLTPELLDSLPCDHPGAIRSRRDLRFINRFLGNNRWILDTIPPDTSHIMEIGAGDGSLLSTIATKFPEIPLTAVDLASPPANLPPGINWIQGDILHQPSPSPGGCLIANLFLHHFEAPLLIQLGRWMKSFQTIISNEPHRSSLPLILGKFSSPLFHPVTRHDMRVSIEAGFVPGELPALLDLPARFTILEKTDPRGAIRMRAARTPA